MTIPANPYDRKNRRIVFSDGNEEIDPVSFFKKIYKEKNEADGKRLDENEGAILLTGPNGFGKSMTVGAWKKYHSGHIRICARKFFTDGQLDFGDWHGLFYNTRPGLTKRWGICMPGRSRFSAFGSIKMLMKRYQILSR